MRSCLGGAAWLACAACTTFGTATDSDGGAGSSSGGGADRSCVEACAAGGTCRTYDFSSGCDGWTFSGNLGMVTGECANGFVHVAAKDTLDIIADVDLDVPPNTTEIHVSGAVTMTHWHGTDGAPIPLFGITVNNKPIAFVQPTEGPNGFTIASCSDATSCSSSPATTVGFDEPHLYKIELKRNVVSVSVDCAPAIFHTTATFDFNQAAFAVFLGNNEGSPIDGKLRDVVVTYQ